VIQPLTNRDKQLIQQLVTTLVPTTIQVNTSLLIYVPTSFVHQPLDGGQPRDSPGRNSPKGYPPRGPPFNPLVGLFRWPTLDPHMFIPPWYQPPIVQLVLEPTTKRPYMKLQYPTYVKDTNSDAHIKMFKKAIKANGEIVEVDIINMFGFTFIDSMFEWGENFVQNHPNCTFEKLEQTFCK
jgi:hypothetical protein